MPVGAPFDEITSAKAAVVDELSNLSQIVAVTLSVCGWAPAFDVTVNVTSALVGVPVIVFVCSGWVTAAGPTTCRSILVRPSLSSACTAIVVAWPGSIGLGAPAAVPTVPVGAPLAATGTASAAVVAEPPEASSRSAWRTIGWLPSAVAGTFSV